MPKLEEDAGACDCRLGDDGGRGEGAGRRVGRDMFALLRNGIFGSAWSVAKAVLDEAGCHF